MAAAIQQEFGFESELIAESGGIFDIHVDGKLVYSKHAEDNQFPEHQLVLDRLTKMKTA